MELGPALITVGASYAGYLLAWRRVRALRGRARGPEPSKLGVFDHEEIERELSGLVARRPDVETALRYVAARARQVDATPAGPVREEAAREALASLRRLRDLPLEAPTWSALAAHLEVQRLSFWTLERAEVVVRRRLRRSLARHSDAPSLHLVRAHLEASLGNGDAAADHLARALYYAKGASFYARPIADSPAVARLRPALAAQARAVLEADRSAN